MLLCFSDITTNTQTKAPHRGLGEFGRPGRALPLVMEVGNTNTAHGIPLLEINFSLCLLKMTKYMPLVRQGRARFFLPIVIGSDGTIHPTTSLELSRYGVDMIKFKQEVAHILLWHYSKSAVAYANLPYNKEEHPKPLSKQPVATIPNHFAIKTSETARTTVPVTAPNPPAPRSTSHSPSIEIVPMPQPHSRKLGRAEMTRVRDQNTHEGTSANTFTLNEVHITDVLNEISDFVRSRTPSPSPLPKVASPPTSAAAQEPDHKALPSFFKRLDKANTAANASKPSIFKRLADPPVQTQEKKFYPFKRLDTTSNSSNQHQIVRTPDI